MLKKMSLLVTATFFLNACAAYEKGKLINIEDSNSYVWQKYMNEQEFDSLEEGMSYLDVVNTAKGMGKQQEKDLYVWQDENTLTKAYEIKFQDDQLIEKRIVELKGHSTR